MKSGVGTNGYKSSYASNYTAGKGSPSLKENGGSITSNYLASLKYSTKNKNLKMGSPTSDSYQGRYKGSPDINKVENPLRVIQNKYLPSKANATESSPQNERSNTPTIMQKLANQRRATGKKLSFSPSPSTGSPNDRGSSANKSFTDNGSPKPNSPPRGMAALSGSRGSPKVGKTTGIGTSIGSVLYNSNSHHQSGGGLVYPGSPSSHNAEYLLNARKHPYTVYSVEGIKVTHKCINHDDKRSKFYVVEDKTVQRISGHLDFMRGVCSLCAARLANLNFKTVELCSEEEEERREMLKGLLDKIETAQDFHTQSYHSIEAKKNKLKRFYEKEFSLLDDFESNIDRVISMLQQNKTDMRALMEAEYQNEFQKLADIQTVVNSNLGTINLIHHDTNRSYDRILREGTDDLEGAIRKYEQKLTAFNRNTRSGIKSKALVLKIARVSGKEILQFGTKMNNWFKINQEELEDEDQDGELDADISAVNASFEDELSTPADRHETATKSQHMHGLSQDDAKSSKTAVCVSFDNIEIFESALAQEQGLSGAKGPIIIGGSSIEHSDAGGHQKSSNHKIISLLDKISESQNEKNNYYNSLVKPKGKFNDENRDGESLFVIPPPEEDFSSKQTPELGGQKEEVPDFLREQLERMHQQMHPGALSKAIKPTHVESLQEQSTNSTHNKSKAESVQRSEIVELFNHIGSTAGKDGDQSYGPTKCQKILFNDKK